MNEPLPELVVLLGGRVGQVLEDYDSVKCQHFYSDSSCVTSVARSDTVRKWCSGGEMKGGGGTECKMGPILSCNCISCSSLLHSQIQTQKPPPLFTGRSCKLRYSNFTYCHH